MNRPIATLTRTNEILKQFDLSAKRSYGQNFIIDPSVVKNIAEHAMLDESSAVIEIGPGIGALSEQLAQRAGRVQAYEIDKDLIEVLKKTLSDYQNIEVIAQDFLEINLEETIRKIHQDYKKVMICSNLPYYITTAILMKVFQCEEKIDVITVMMQKEVADHFFLSPGSKDYGAINVIMESGFDVERIMKVPRTVFEPKPNVESVVLRFKAKDKRLPQTDRKRFYDLVKACFKQRRKSLLNNYGEFLHNKEKAKADLDRAQLNFELRAEALSLKQFLDLFEAEMGEGEKDDK